MFDAGQPAPPSRDLYKVCLLYTSTELTQQAAVELSACAADGYNIFSVSKAIRTGTRDRCLQKIRLFGTRR